MKKFNPADLTGAYLRSKSEPTLIVEIIAVDIIGRAVSFTLQDRNTGQESTITLSELRKFWSVLKGN